MNTDIYAHHIGIEKHLYLVSEEVNGHSDEIMILEGLWNNWLNHIHAFYLERPLHCHDMQGCGSYMYFIYIDLAFMALASIINVIILHSYPKVS